MNDAFSSPLPPGSRLELSLEPEESEFSRIKELIFGSGLPKKESMELCLAAEEIFVNICAYAFKGCESRRSRVDFFLELSQPVRLRFADSGRPYDPRKGVASAENYDINGSVGGLGRLIAFTVTDGAEYEYKDGRNILTLIKYIKEQ